MAALLDMSGVWFSALAGLVVGVGGTLAGALLSLFCSPSDRSLLGGVLQFSAGLMLGVACFDLLPHALSYAGLPGAISGVLLGMALLALMQRLFCTHGHEKGACSVHGGLALTAFSMAVGMAMHNFPEGIAVGAGFAEDMRLGLTLCAVLMIHNIPEGLGVALPLRLSGQGRVRALLFTALSGLPMAVGAAAGTALGGLSDGVLALCLSSAAGAMLYVVWTEMLPQAASLTHGRSSVRWGLAGLIFGIVISVGFG